MVRVLVIGICLALTVAASAAAEPAFIARGPFGDAPFAITDATGRPLAYASGERLPGALSACPGGTHMLDGLTIRRISDLAVVGTLAGGRAPGEIRCLSADGTKAVGFTSDRLSTRGELVRLTPEGSRTLAKGRWALAALGARRTALAAVQPAGTLVVVDNASGRRRVVRRQRRNGVDVELSPDETRVAETVAKRRGERATQAFVHDLSQGTSVRRRIEGHDLVWYRADRIASVTYDNHAWLYDPALRRVSNRFGVSDGSTFGASGDLWWIRGGELHRRGAAGFPMKLELPVRGPLIPLR